MRGNDILLYCGKNFSKIITAVIILRVALALGYDCLHKEIIAPDGAFYSASALVSGGTDIRGTWDREVIMWYWMMLDDTDYGRPYKRLINATGNNDVFHWVYFMKKVYSVFGYKPIIIRLTNVFISIVSAFFLYGVFRCRWALLLCLILPTQVIYSVSMCRDFMREFVVCGVLWLFYWGEG